VSQITLLDDYIVSCVTNKSRMPIYQHMSAVLREATPVMHIWDTQQPLVVPLPNGLVEWPDHAMCLGTFGGINNPNAPYHRFCVDVDYVDGEFDIWFNKRPWFMAGALVFQDGPASFDVIPLVRDLRRAGPVLHEVQLRYVYEAGRWCWCKAHTGPVNPMFHDVFIAQMEPDDRELVDANIWHLGSVMNLYLGSYWQHINKAGAWVAHPAKEPRIKKRGDKVVKIYREPTVGYKQFELLKGQGT
jgi:hypothetical protein